MAVFTSEDVNYLSHGDRKIMARVFKPEGVGRPRALSTCMAARGTTATSPTTPVSANTSPRAA
jgi:hypothetical protein